MIVIDADERPISISPALRPVLGLSLDSLLPDTLCALTDEASAIQIHTILHGGSMAQRHPLAIRLTASEGRSLPAAAELLPTTGGGAVLVVSIDPAPWSNEDAARLLDHSHDLIFSVRLTPTFSFRYINAASTLITGYGPDELQAAPTTFLEAIHPDDRVCIGAALADARRLEAPVIFRFLHRGGEWRWLELFGTPVVDETGGTVVVDGVVRDVTVRHRLEEQFRLLVERSPEMVYRIRLAPYCATDYISPACEAVTGRPPEKFYGDPWLLLQYVHPDDRVLLEGCVDRPRDFCSRPLLFRIFHPDGSLHWIEQINVPVCDDAGGLIAIEGVCRDVTERQEVEATLQGMNRRVNLLASLTRHDFPNQLTVLLGSLELAGAAESAVERSWFLGRSRAAAWAIQRLAEFNRDYQEIGQGAPRWVSVTALVRHAADFFPGEGMTIDIPDEQWEIRADQLIEKVFYNLIENALRHGGTVERIRFSVEVRPAGGLTIVCEDNGVGVPVNEKERIFERGYGRNTGLGLYLSSEILATTGMTIAETGRPGAGTRFEIRVPPEMCRTSSAPGREGLLLHRG